jgi:non-ribosomal peptide synthetase component E (peptide arylation enzyme)
LAYQTLLLEVEDSVAILTLNRPEKRNAMNPQLHEDMRVASYKKPRFLHPIAALPRTHNGKIDKKQLRVLARQARDLAS